MTELQIDVLCTIQYLSNDRRSKTLPSLTNIGVFLRGSAKSKRKSFMKKYDTYGKYPKIINEEIDSILGYLGKQGFVNRSRGVTISKNGIAFLAEYKPSALQNPYVLENEAINSGEDYHYIGQYACYYRLDVFKKKTLNEVLDRLEGYSSKVSPYPLREEQVRAWTDTYEVLQAALRDIPKRYHNLYVVFEYVLPTHKPGSKRSADDNGIRADVILISKTVTMVLEFKQRDDDFDGFVSQAQKYTTRLNRFHGQAMHMKNQTALVLTKASQYLKRHEAVTSCSGDYLSDVIQIVFDRDCERHEDIKGWLKADFITE